VGGGTLPKGNKQKTYLNFRNNLIMLSKNLPAGEAVWKVIFRMNLNEIFALKALLSGDAETFVAVIKAHFEYLNWLLFQRKKSIFPAKQNKNLSGLYNGLVVWQYFIKKKKLFSEIIKTKNEL
jgi:hypothetical protein